MKDFIVFDLETIGLKPENGKIIEIAALKIKDWQIVDEYDQLINPEMKVPAVTTNLTGIKNTDLTNKPKIQEILPEFLEFIGDMDLVGHNATSFDKVFIDYNLKKYNIISEGIKNKCLDSLELAIFLKPEFPKHKLEYLHQQLVGKKIKQTHRAIDDCKVLLEVLEKLKEKRDTDWDKSWLDHVGEISKSQNWPWASFILENNAQKLSKVNELLDVKSYIPAIARKQENKNDYAEQDDNISSVNKEDIKKFFRENGLLKKHLKKYEHRQQQEDLSLKITDAINNRNSLVAEAPTGCGKSLSYLIPAAFWSIKNNQPVVCSTYTNQLQDQLVDKEVRLLKNIDIFKDLKVTVVKGREHYICLRKLRDFFDEVVSVNAGPGFFEDKFRIPDKMFAVFLANWVIKNQKKHADYDKFNYWLKKKTRVLSNQICSDRESCMNQYCEYYNKCFLNKLKSDAKESNITIANHSLVFLDKLKRNNTLLPDYKLLIIDEAINIESAVTDASTKSFNFKEVLWNMNSLFNPAKISAGLLYQIQNFLKKNDQSLMSEIEKASNSIVKIVTEAEIIANNIRKRHSGEKDLKYSVRKDIDKIFVDSIRPQIENININLNNISSFFNKFIEKHKEENTKNLNKKIELSIFMLNDYQQILDQLILLDKNSNIIFYEAPISLDDFSLNICQKNVGKYLADKLYNDTNLTVIFTSATLTYNDNFDFVRKIWGLDAIKNIEYLKLDYYFDYKSQSALLVFNDIPQKKIGESNFDYYSEVSKLAEGLIINNYGSSMIILTNNHDVIKIGNLLSDELDKKNIPLFSLVNLDNLKAFTGNKSNIIEDFKENIESCIIGSAGLRDGVDVPGKSLDMVIIIRFPFRFPDDPIVKERSKIYGGFSGYSLPLCVFEIKQAFGRLIRTKNDNGFVCLLDSRAGLDKSTYFKDIINNLPPDLNIIAVNNTGHEKVFNLLVTTKYSKNRMEDFLANIIDSESDEKAEDTNATDIANNDIINHEDDIEAEDIDDDEDNGYDDYYEEFLANDANSDLEDYDEDGVNVGEIERMEEAEREDLREQIEDYYNTDSNDEDY
ncbi:MAG: exonuclease domain-containing protein [Candidatus Parcubacteria bacterium]|nr:exonuclease domain-containing protein [Candidatus Parcubacteria bacterium]